MKQAIVNLYFFKDLSEEAQQKALKILEEPLIEIGDMIFSTEELKEVIDSVYFLKDGSLA